MRSWLLLAALSVGGLSVSGCVPRAQSGRLVIDELRLGPAAAVELFNPGDALDVRGREAPGRRAPGLGREEIANGCLVVNDIEVSIFHWRLNAEN